MPAIFPFTAIVGQERMKRALVLNAIYPLIGGVLVRGERGTAKSTAVRALALGTVAVVLVSCGRAAPPATAASPLPTPSAVLPPCRGASVTQPVESSTAPSSAAHLFARASARIVHPQAQGGTVAVHSSTPVPLGNAVEVGEGVVQQCLA